ncbi:MAG: TolC family protein [Bacteroidaceae bacterium]|nr:TolC family protein [Bacteroidaceae bacterium]
MKAKRMTWMMACLVCGSTLMAQEVSTEQATSEGTTQTVRPQQWTLQSCIDYALEQNITIRRNRLTAASSEIDVKTAKADFLPSINGSLGGGLTNRPWANSTANYTGGTFATTNNSTSYSGNAGLNLNWTLFNGRRLNTLKQNEVNAEISDLNVEESENTIIQNITQLYIQILYSAEAVKVNEANLELSKANLARGQQMFEAGSISKVDLAQLQTQVSQDEYSLVNVEAQLIDYKLQLKQLLEIEGDEEMDIYMPELSDENVLTLLPEKNEVYMTALVNRPEILSAQKNIDAADLNIKIQKAGYLPSLSLSAGASTNAMSGLNQELGNQLKKNVNNNVNLNLSIPIFDKRQTKSNIEKAKIQKNQQELALQDAQKTLYRNIENLWQNANTAQKQYVAASANLESSQTSYDMTQEQFNLGMKNTIELLQERNNLLSAQQQKLQAKYTAIMNEQLLNFYAGETITLE